MLVPLMGKQAQSSIKILILFINHCAKILTLPPLPPTRYQTQCKKNNLDATSVSLPVLRWLVSPPC